VPNVPGLIRVGHKGADHVAPGNTVESFEAALEHGVDMIEFDVLRQGGRLLLAHDPEDARRPDVITLSEGLDHLMGTGVELDVDLKWHGYEAEVVDELRARDLLDRVLVSTMELRSINAIRALDPAVRLGLSVPKVRRDPRDRRPVARYPAYARLGVVRELLPGRAARAIRAGRYDALMSHQAMVSPKLVAAVHGAGGELYVWTVDDAERITALEALGVDGVITNDPRLFS
jgi:glycerophosphoryl diester phosphodiesterase